MNLKEKYEYLSYMRIAEKALKSDTCSQSYCVKKERDYLNWAHHTQLASNVASFEGEGMLLSLAKNKHGFVIENRHYYTSDYGPAPGCETYRYRSTKLVFLNQRFGKLFIVGDKMMVFSHVGLASNRVAVFDPRQAAPEAMRLMDHSKLSRRDSIVHDVMAVLAVMPEFDPSHGLPNKNVISHAYIFRRGRVGEIELQCVDTNGSVSYIADSKTYDLFYVRQYGYTNPVSAACALTFSGNFDEARFVIEKMLGESLPQGIRKLNAGRGLLTNDWKY